MPNTTAGSATTVTITAVLRRLKGSVIAHSQCNCKVNEKLNNHRDTLRYGRYAVQGIGGATIIPGGALFLTKNLMTFLG